MEKVGKEEGELLKMESLENENRFLSKLKSIFIFLRTFFWLNLESSGHNHKKNVLGTIDALFRNVMEICLDEDDRFDQMI